MEPFDSHVLCEDSGFSVAVDTFQVEVLRNRRRFELERGLEDIVARPGLFPRLVSRIDDESFGLLWAYLKNELLQEPDSDFRESIPLKMVTGLRAYFEELSIPVVDVDVQARKTTKYLSQLLKSAEDFGGLAPTSAGKSTPREEKARRGFVRTVRDLAYPLKTYLDIIRDERMADTITRYHIGQLEAEGVRPAGQREAVVGTTSPTSTILSRKRAAVTLDLLDGHGPWKITVSTRMIENLRASKGSPRLFAKIGSTLQELSEGHFDGRNQLVLTSNGIHPSIYMAHLSQHCSLVYHHVQASKTGQELRVFGVYPSKALEAHEFWDACSRELVAGDSSPPGDVSSKADPEFVDRVRSLVVLDRYVEYSKPVVQRILDDEEIKAMFEPSRQEEEVVEYDGSCLLHGRSGTGKTTVMLLKILTIELTAMQFGEDAALKPRQLFVTRSSTLAERVRESFARLHDTYVKGGRGSDHTNGVHSESHNQTRDWCSIPPDDYRDLNSEHFPLFISFDKLCSMLETALYLPCLSETTRRGETSGHGVLLMNYDIFLAQYWDTFPKHITKNMDPFLAYGEIIGVIKGSEETLSTGQRSLTRDEYVGLPPRSYRTFAGRRHDLYTVFEWYNIRTRHLDIADRTHTILEAFQRAVHTCARTIDFVYVDEAQDNLLIDAMIVRALCKNANGLLWAGDTAQTIFAGSSFTFNTLKAFLYRQEEKEPIGFRAKQRPAFFTLTTNFRSRGGIVECGQTVLDLISEFWPGSVDQIPKEAISSGSRPYFFHNAKGADLDLRRLLSESNNLLEFGAEQAIIVRNGVIRDFLRQHLGDSMIVLTLYDSKGLEFNDVLLFNFFSDSWYSQSDWEVLLGAGNADHHIGISIELKFLYVATTRAKKRLWIIDDSEKATSLQRIWASRDQIVTETNRLDLSQFAVASNANEWERRAREFFQDARYRLAAQAFRMAKLEHDANMANAFDLRIQVETLSPTSPLHVHTLREAAEAFLTIASAEQCKRSQREHYIVSAEFFVRIPDSAKAATAFVHAGEYRRGLLLFRSAGMFDEAIAIVNAHPEHIESALSDGVVQAAKLQFCRTGQASKAVALFGDVEDAVQFTELHGLRGAQMKLLSLSSRHDEAALLALKANQPTEWLKIHAQHLASCDQQGTRYTPALIEALTRQAATLVFKSSQQSLDKSQDLLQIVKIWNDSIGVSETVEVREEVLMLRAVLSSDAESLQHHRPPTILANPVSSFLSLFHALHLRTQPPGKSSLGEICDWLRSILDCLRALRTLLRIHHLPEERSVQRLFGFRPISSQRYRLRRDGLGAQVVSEKQPRLLKTSDVFYTMSRTSLGFILRSFLEDILREQVADVLRRYPDMNTFCTHEKRDAGSTKLRAVCLVVLIQDSLRGIEPDDDHSDRKRLLLKSIYGPFVGNDLKLTSTISTALRRVPEGSRFVHVTSIWIREALQDNARIPAEDRPTLFLQLALLANVVRGSEAALDLGYGRRLATSAPRAWLLIHPPKAPIRHQRAHFHLNDLLDAVEGVRPHALHSGALFLTHLVRTRFPVDAHTLCDFIDYVTAAFSMAVPGTTTQSTVLSLRCSLLMVENVRHMLEQDTEAIKVWLKLLQAILREAMELKSDGFLLLEGTPLRAPGHYDIITRICQSLGLLAYNLNDAALREQVLAIVGSLPALDPRVTHSLYNRFAQVRTWVQLSAIVTSQALPTVRMWKRADDLGVSKYSLTYKTLKKEPSADKISDTKPARSTSSRKSAGLETRIVDQLTVETPQAVDLEFKRLCVALDGVTAAPAKRAISETAMAANALEGRLNDALSGPGLPDSHLLQALYRIQAFVRHAMRRRRKLPASAAAPLLSSNITACFQRCLALSFSTTERHQFLGPLPHVLTCLDLLQMHFEFEKDILSKKLMKVAHTELEEAGLQVLRAHTPLTKTLELQKCLQPLSELYLRDGWLLAFRSYVAEVGGLLREVKLDGAELGDLMAQWDIVQTSVLNIHRTRK